MDTDGDWLLDESVADEDLLAFLRMAEEALARARGALEGRDPERHPTARDLRASRAARSAISRARTRLARIDATLAEADALLEALRPPAAVAIRR